MYRIVLACSGIPSNEGPSGAESIREEFTLMDEFSDAISSCIVDAGDGGIKVVSVTAFSEEGS